jgi:hypothetical protein
MDPAMLRRFEKPDEVRVFAKGTFGILHLAGMMLGRTSYKPGAAVPTRVFSKPAATFRKVRGRMAHPIVTGMKSNHRA